MSKVTLPRLNQTGANEWSDVEANDVALREVVNGGLDNENIAVGANIARSKLEASAQGVSGTWYTPSIVATEQTITTTTYKTMAENGAGGTADSISGVVLPTNGLIAVVFRAAAKCTVANAQVAIFLGSTQLSADDGAGNLSGQAATLSGSGLNTVMSSPGGLQALENGTGSDLTTGVVASGFGSAVGATFNGGVCLIYAAAGTYTVSVKYKNAVGTVTAKNRKLWVYVLGT